MDFLIIIFLALFGAVMGSFVGALTWRLHEKKNFVTGRSECEKCHHKLAGVDLIPIFSWLFLGGRCRFCRKKIGWLAIIVEVAMAAVFVASYFFWPFGFNNVANEIAFVLWLILLTGLAVLFVYDARWKVLPNKVLFPSIAVALTLGLVQSLAVQHMSLANYAIQFVLALLPIAGFYGFVFAVSKGKWIGFGDVKFGILAACVLTWQQALAVLMLANILGTIVVVPLLISQKMSRQDKLAFGPFLIIALVILYLIGTNLTNMLSDLYLQM